MKTLRISEDSMKPILLYRDVVFFKKSRFSRIGMNDIVCARKNRVVFTHRVIYKTKTYLITRGDNNLKSDGKIYPKNILGTVHKVQRNEHFFDIEDLYLMQSTLYFNEIIKLNKALKKAQIDFVFLKGLPLHLYFEGKKPRRIYADCDILVDNFIRTEKVLKKLGYTIENMSEEDFWMKKEKEISFYKIINGFPVVFDIHKEVVFVMLKAGNLNLLYTKSMTKELTHKFIKEKMDICVNGEIFPILKKENLFVYLCLHLFHHDFKGAYRYDFIKKVLDDKLDDTIIIQIISKFNLGNFVRPALTALDHYYNSQAARRILKLIKGENNKSSFTVKNIFDEDTFGSGNYFELAFRMSPSPIWKKSLIFLDPQVVIQILKVLFKKTTFYKSSVL